MRKKQIVIDFQQKFGDEQGARVLADLERRCVLFREGINYTKGVDTNALLVMEGEANVLKYIYKMLNRNPNEVVQTHALNITSIPESAE